MQHTLCLESRTGHKVLLRWNTDIGDDELAAFADILGKWRCGGLIYISEALFLWERMAAMTLAGMDHDRV